MAGQVMYPGSARPHLLVQPTETPPCEGCTAEAHEEKADGGLWEHPYLWLGLIVLGMLVTAAYFVARIGGL